MYPVRNLPIYHTGARIVGLSVLSLLVACVSSPSQLAPAPTSTPLPTGTTAPAPDNTPGAAYIPTECALTPILIPTLPAIIPGYIELDTSTNLHMTGNYQVIDLASYRLEITGNVDHPMLISYDELRCMPKVTQRLVLNCPGYFIDEASWSGVPLEYLLKLAGFQPQSYGIQLVSADGYYVAVSLEDVRTSQPFIAYEWEGQPLPILHGFPVRAVFPHMSGGKWVKWLVKIEVIR
jgi:DMSO/TMAO reductase YedYZ molybdopterin-dependent catalytic subunit